MSEQKAYIRDLRRDTSDGRPGWAFSWPKYPIDQATFVETLRAFKLAVPLEERVWREEAKEWWISERCADFGHDWIFANWDSEIERVKAQIPLPGFGL